MNRETYTGIWWLPGQENQKIFGTFYIDSNEIFSLHTFQNFKIKNSNNSFFGDSDYDIILGIGKNEKTGEDFAFKLLNSFTKRGGSKKLTFYEFTVNSYLISNSDDTSENLSFSKVAFKLDFLEDWVGVDGFNLELDPSDRFGFNVSYQQPEIIQLYEGKDFAISIFVRASFSYPKLRGFQANQSVVIQIIFPELKSLPSIQDTVRDVKNFFSLAIGEILHYYDFEVWLDNNISFKYFHLGKANAPSTKQKRNFSMPLNYKMICSNSQEVFSKWFEIGNELKFTFRNFFNFKNDGSRYLEDIFLSHIFALEVYHRTRYKGFDLKDEIYLQFRDRVLSQVSDKNDKQWLEARLKKHSENSLQTRILHLLKIFSESLKGLFSDEKIFVKQIVETRHYLVHEQVKNFNLVVKEPASLQEIQVKLRIFLEAIIMVELGFAQNFVNERLKVTGKNLMAFEDDENLDL